MFLYFFFSTVPARAVGASNQTFAEAPCLVRMEGARSKTNMSTMPAMTRKGKWTVSALALQFAFRLSWVSNSETSRFFFSFFS